MLTSRQSLRTIWRVGIAFAGLGFLLTFLEKEVKLRDKLNTEFGIDEKREERRSRSDVEAAPTTEAPIELT